MVRRTLSHLAPFAACVLWLTSTVGAQLALQDRVQRATAPITSLSGFVANHGQWDSEILFFSREAGIEATLFRDALMLRPQRDPESKVPRSAPLVLRLPGVGAAELVGEELLPTKYHFLLGEISTHTSNVPSYARVLYRDVAPGIDLLVRSEDTGFAYDLHVAPGADLSALELRFEGASSPRVRDDGVLVLDTASGPVEQHIGAAWEINEATGERIEIASSFRLLDSPSGGSLHLGFDASTRDAQRAFVLDPSLIFSTYVGGTGQDNFHEMDVGPDGSMYLIARIAGGGMPVGRNAPDSLAEGSEAWVGKLSPDGSRLEWATYLGGEFTETVTGVHVDSDGTVVAVGRTWSGDFPSTPGSLQPVSGSPGLADVFITRLAADGASLVWSTFYGGPEQEGVDTSALFPNGDVLVSGLAKASMPAATPGTYDTQWDPDDIFLLRVSADGTAVVFQSFFLRLLFDVLIGPDSKLYLAGAVNSATEGTILEHPAPISSFPQPAAPRMDSLRAWTRSAERLSGRHTLGGASPTTYWVLCSMPLARSTLWATLTRLTSP